MTETTADVLIVGAGIAGVAAAFELSRHAPGLRVALLERGQPLSLTTARAGENYRDWWPHPVMARLVRRSLDLVEALSEQAGDRLAITRRGYLLATRRALSPDGLAPLLGDVETGAARLHEDASPPYAPALDDEWRAAPSGVDAVLGATAVRRAFPWLAEDVETAIHIRRAGDFSLQQLGLVMLERFRAAGGRVIAGDLVDLDRADGFKATLSDGRSIAAERLINAAGPFADRVGAMIGASSPITHVLQQKVAFEDRLGVLPRRAPFTIDLDPQRLDWSDEERALLAEDPATAPLAGALPGAIHSRPDGGLAGRWIKLGWALNAAPSPNPVAEPDLDPSFPDIVLRGASRLHPGLKAYYGALPRAMSHYGGYYTMTPENWPLIGPMTDADGAEIDGAVMIAALSGFGAMAASAAGELAAFWTLGRPPSADAIALSPRRYADAALMRSLDGADRGLL